MFRILGFLLLAAWLGAEPVKRERSMRDGSFSYYSMGKRDPFQPLSLERSGRGLASVSPVERHSIEKYQLKAILKGLGAPKAMFEDPDGNIFILVPGDILGRQRAVISRILFTGVMLTENTINYRGEARLFEHLMTLPVWDDLSENSKMAPLQAPSGGSYQNESKKESAEAPPVAPPVAPQVLKPSDINDILKAGPNLNVTGPNLP